ncbi:MAG: aldehyde dehydrogenase family protein, partial [Candidatus Promineifilaceae bacterium]|nr:aldehyde dehydrogenase family protein [Candidatus Promineifilaceae bacterium]
MTMSQTRETLACINPATFEQFDEVPLATAEEVTAARREMGAAALIWAAKPVKERVRIIRRLQEEIIDSVDEITAVINKDHGKSRQDAAAEVLMTVDKIHQYLKRAPKWLKERSVPRGIYFFRKYSVEPRPYGVVLVIGPWNYPFELIVPATVSALLAGNTVLVKPSEVAASTGVLIEQLFQRIPELAPFVRFLHGDGRVGAALVDSRPDLIFLTGSTKTGQIVAQKAAETMTPFLCELGGKDPMIVLEDADIPAAAKWGVWSAATFNTGQSCVAVERIYVVEDVYDEFVQLAVEEAKKVKMGYTASKECFYNMGPLTFQRQVDIVEDQLQDALAKGARIIHGGSRDGMYMEPTILIDVDHTMKVMRDETFGPLIPIMKVKDENHAVQLANHSDFGLSAYVWSGSRKRAERIARRLDVGTVNINDVMVNYPVSLLPFGGVKMSGNARTHGKEEVMQFTQLRSYAVGRPPIPFDVSTMLRYPNRYWLMVAVIRSIFGVSPRQRVQPVKDLVEEKEFGAKAGKAVFATGALAALAAIAFGLIRFRRN